MSIQVSPEQLQSLSDCLLNVKGNTPLHERFRALFTLKAVGGKEVVEIVAKGFADPSPLLKHELAYVLGQISQPTAVPYLEAVLIDADNFQGEMVRHEAAEALGALSSLESIPLLKKYLNDESRSVRETCEIAIAKIEWDHSEDGKARSKDPLFPTIDPAPASNRPLTSALAAEEAASQPTSSSNDESVPALQSTLLNTSLPLFDRYRAMFALRNKSTPESVHALALGFKDSSALFRHEIAYVFGQLSSPYSIPSLLEVLRDQGEDEMVRHEAAEALGGIASEGEDEIFDNEEDKAKGVLGILREWSAKEDAPRVVRESCQVAIDMWEYENSNQFQYADKLNAEDDDAETTATTTTTTTATTPAEPAAAKPRLTGMDRGVDVASLTAAAAAA